MPAITVKLELTEGMAKELDVYIDENCLDRDKWLQRIVYMGIFNAAGRYKYPRRKCSPVFKKQPVTQTAKNGGKK